MKIKSIWSNVGPAVYTCLAVLALTTGYVIVSATLSSCSDDSPTEVVDHSDTDVDTDEDTDVDTDAEQLAVELDMLMSAGLSPEARLRGFVDERDARTLAWHTPETLAQSSECNQCVGSGCGHPEDGELKLTASLVGRTVLLDVWMKDVSAWWLDEDWVGCEWPGLPLEDVPVPSVAAIGADIRHYPEEAIAYVHQDPGPLPGSDIPWTMSGWNWFEGTDTTRLGAFVYPDDCPPIPGCPYPLSAGVWYRVGQLTYALSPSYHGNLDFMYAETFDDIYGIGEISKPERIRIPRVIQGEAQLNIPDEAVGALRLTRAQAPQGQIGVRVELRDTHGFLAPPDWTPSISAALLMVQHNPPGSIDSTAVEALGPELLPYDDCPDAWCSWGWSYSHYPSNPTTGFGERTTKLVGSWYIPGNPGGAIPLDTGAWYDLGTILYTPHPEFSGEMRFSVYHTDDDLDGLAPTADDLVVRVAFPSTSKGERILR